MNICSTCMNDIEIEDRHEYVLVDDDQCELDSEEID